jgi:hypothetical protein
MIYYLYNPVPNFNSFLQLQIMDPRKKFLLKVGFKFALHVVLDVVTLGAAEIVLLPLELIDLGLDFKDLIDGCNLIPQNVEQGVRIDDLANHVLDDEPEIAEMQQILSEVADRTDEVNDALQVVQEVIEKLHEESRSSSTISARRLNEIRKRITHCRLCGAIGVNMRTCPRNPKAIHPRFDKHWV